MNPDFGATSTAYARHRAGFPDSLFAALKQRGIGLPDQRIVDLGTGTGSLARGFAMAGAQVTGIDHAAEMLDAARVLDERENVSVDYCVGAAEETGVPDASCDCVSAGQCWHWFDRPRAAAEVRRMLKPAGKVVIVHFDWLPLAGNLVSLTEGLIEQHNPAWTLGGGNGLYPQWLRDLGEAGFRNIATFSYDEDVRYSPEDWRGRIRASAGVGGSLGAQAVARFDRELAESLARKFPQDTLSVPHRVFAVIAEAPRQ